MTTTQNTVADRLAAIEEMQQDYHEQCADRDRALGMRPGTYTEVAVPLRDLDWLIAELKAAREVIAWYADTKNYTDDTIDHYTSGIVGHSQQVNHLLDPEEHDWIPDNGRRARAYLNRGAE